MNRNIQRPGDLLDVVQRDIPAQSLDMGDEGPVQPCLKRQPILRPTAFSPQALHVERQKRSCVLLLMRFLDHFPTVVVCGICVTGVYVT